MSTIAPVSQQQQYIPTQSQTKVNAAKVDADGDHDNSKAAEVEKTQNKPVSATVGNNVNTTA